MDELTDEIKQKANDLLKITETTKNCQLCDVNKPHKFKCP